MEHWIYGKKQNYLFLPLKQTYRGFIIILTQFYKAKNENEENKIYWFNMLKCK